MWLLGAATFWLLTGASRGCHSAFGSLIERIHSEIGTETVFFADVRDVEVFLSEFLAKNVLVPVRVATGPLTSFALIEDPVILVVQTPLEDTVEVTEVVITRLQRRKFVVIIADDLHALTECFDLMMEYRFTRIYGIAAGDAFVYLPFADNPVQRLIPEGPLPDGLRDFNGFSVRTTVQTELPRVFWYKNQQEEWAIGGSVGQMFLAFLRRCNATLIEVLINNSSTLFIPGIINATISGDIDVSMNTYNPMDGVDLSYPLALMAWTIMVPLNGQVDPNQYFVRPFTPGVWISIALIVVFIVVMNILTDYYANMPVCWWHHFSRTFLTLLSQPSGGRPIARSYRLQAQVHLLGFILTNLYTVYLTSFLTVFINIKQHNTIQDLIDNNMRVMMTNYEWVLIEPQDLHKAGFENIVALVDGPVYTRERNSMRNTSFGYAVGMDKAEFLLRLQATYEKPRFHTIRDSLGDFYLGFLLPKHSIFREILDRFIVEVKATGLEEKWLHDAVVQGSKAGLIDATFIPQEGQSPLTVNHLRATWTLLTVGLAVASAVFVVEFGLGHLWRLCSRLCL